MGIGRRLSPAQSGLNLGRVLHGLQVIRDRDNWKKDQQE